MSVYLGVLVLVLVSILEGPRSFVRRAAGCAGRTSSQVQYKYPYRNVAYARCRRPGPATAESGMRLHSRLFY